MINIWLNYYNKNRISNAPADNIIRAHLLSVSCGVYLNPSSKQTVWPSNICYITYVDLMYISMLYTKINLRVRCRSHKFEFIFQQSISFISIRIMQKVWVLGQNFILWQLWLYSQNAWECPILLENMMFTILQDKWWD